MFLAGCALVWAALCLLLPRFYPLLEPDSSSYLQSSPTRTTLYPMFLRLLSSIGLEPAQMTYVQVALFSLALTLLLGALLRAGVPRLLVLLYVIALGGNLAFASFMRTILTESLFFTVTVVALAFLLDYLRTGKIHYLALTGLCFGILVGIRPAGLVLSPFLILAVWLKWPVRNASAALMVAALIIPIAVGPVAERIAYRIAHGDHHESILPYILLGKAAMLVEPDTRFTGPHAQVLSDLGDKVYRKFKPVRAFLANVPTLSGRAVLTATYEGVGWFEGLRDEVTEASQRSGVPGDVLRYELGKQAILGNIKGYLQLSMTHYVGQWFITALTFPPISRAVNAYVDSVKVPLEQEVSAITLHPPASLYSVVVYPAFVIAGVVTFLLSFVFIPFLFCRGAAGRARTHYLLMASFFSVMCQVYTVFMSLANVSTPRFLMAVYPQLGLVALFLILAIRPALATSDPMPCTDKAAA